MHQVVSCMLCRTAQMNHTKIERIVHSILCTNDHCRRPAPTNVEMMLWMRGTLAVVKLYFCTGMPMVTIETAEQGVSTLKLFRYNRFVVAGIDEGTVGV